MIMDMPHGSVLRIEPVRIRRDESDFECVAENGIGVPKIAKAQLVIYTEGQCKYHVVIFLKGLSF